jgi:hypothetical protein
VNIKPLQPDAIAVANICQAIAKKMGGIIGDVPAPPAT